MDYKKDIEIDLDNLADEWLRQPSLYLQYSEAYAESICEKDRRKAVLDYTYSILYAEIKEDWRKYFKSKPTEPACKEWIVRQQKYRDAEKNFILSQKDANILLNVKTAFEHRKKALENLVSLKIGGFYSEPSTKKFREAREAREARVGQQKIQRRQNAKPQSSNAYSDRENSRRKG